MLKCVNRLTYVFTAGRDGLVDDVRASTAGAVGSGAVVIGLVGAWAIEHLVLGLRCLRC